jgi:hypothetical protein
MIPAMICVIDFGNPKLHPCAARIYTLSGACGVGGSASLEVLEFLLFFEKSGSSQPQCLHRHGSIRRPMLTASQLIPHTPKVRTVNIACKVWLV